MKSSYLKIFSGLQLSCTSIELIFKQYFSSDAPFDRSSFIHAMRRKRTLRTIGMDMVKKQANILIDSKYSSDFQVYYHARRQTDKIRKEMHTEISEVQKQKKNEKLRDAFQEAIKAKIDIMQLKAIAKQEIEA